jgi:KipI family sensor histidine kinase inhibitor
VRFLPVNAQALLVELADLDQTLALLHSMQTAPIAGVRELVPAACTMLIEFAPHQTSAAALAHEIAKRNLHAPEKSSDALIEIPVSYNGEDLAEVAQMLGIDAEEVVRRHTFSEWSVAFTGFAPGFAYLTGGDPIFDVPRRNTPRTKVPAGAVALAGTFSAVYPQDTPGGWQLIGMTRAAMWDVSRDQPALLQPGHKVRFVDVSRCSDILTTCHASQSLKVHADARALAATKVHRSETGEKSGEDTRALCVRATGLLTVFQDLGRHRQASQGISASGAMDQKAIKAANRLVGNGIDKPALETVGGGLSLQSRGDNVVAITGADAPITLTTVDGRSWPIARYQAIALADGDSIRIGEPSAGARCYVAARDGFDIVPVLNSASTDTLAKVGPPSLRTGQVLPIHAVGGCTSVAVSEQPPEDLPTLERDVVLDVELGPRTDWFAPEAVMLLAEQRWQVTPQSNRVGLRLAGGAPLERAISRELPSEGTSRGAIQVPTSGQPVLFLADHPLTGGYPVIGCVAPHHLDRTGQIPVGAHIRFNIIRAFEELAPIALPRQIV